MAEVKIDIIAVDSFSGVLGNFGNIMTGLKSTVDLLKSAFDTLVAPVLNFGYESAMAASRVSELKIVNEALADITGNGAVSMGLLAEKIRDQGIEAAVAQQAVAKLMIYELDLTHAVDLATIAQNAAVVAGTNSTDMMDRLIYGITTLNSRVLKTGGIMINLNDAYDAYAATLGTTSDKLDVHQRQQAALNAVLEFGTNIVGLYDLAMENAFKRFGSYSRYINDIQVALGEQLEPSLRNIVFAGSDFLEWIEQGILEGGIFSGIVRQIGESVDETTSKWADNIRKAMDWIETLMEESTVFSHWLSPGGNDMVTQEVDWELLMGNIFNELYGFVKRKLSEIDIPALLFDVGSMLGRIDASIGGFMGLIAREIDNWVDTGGAETLSDSIINWIKNINTSPNFNSNILDAAKKIIEALGKALKEVEWAEIGTAFKDKFEEAIGKLDIAVGDFMQEIADAIRKWVALGGSAKLSKGLIDWIGGLDTSPEFKSAAADGAVAIVGALAEALLDMKWDAIRNAVDEKLTEAILGIEWTKVGKTFADSIGKSISTGLPSGINTQSISNILAGAINPVGLFATLLPKFQLAGGMAGERFATGIINAIFGTDFSNMDEVAYDIGNGIVLGLRDLGYRLQDAFQNAINAVKNVLGIHSPSTVFFEIGKNIVQGLINGIKSLIGGVLSALLEPLQPILDFLGIDFGNLSGGFSAPFTGSTAGLTGAGMATPGTATLGTVTNNYNFYGNVYMQGVGPEGTYDCKTPPLITSSQGSLYAPGY